MGDEEWKKRLNDSGYKNWLKVSLALIESKEALHDFTEKVILDVHKDIKTTAGSGTCTATPSCNTNKGKEPTCPSCAKWVTEIRKYRSDGQLQWKNTDPKMWRTVPWEIAKCFMNAQGGKATAAANTGPAKTDLSGMLNVLVNCKEFRRNYLKDKKLPEHVRTVRNHLMHCATMSFSDAEMQGMVDKVIALLEDDKELKHLKVSKDKVKLIKSLRDSEFELKPKDEEVCIETVLESHALAADSGEEIDESMMSKLSKLIKGNKELERKFNKIDEKFANMKQECDAEISRVDIDLGELKGRIEFLEKKLASGQSFPSSNPTSSVLGHEIKSFYKNALQSCAQKKKLDIPKYNTNETKEKMFISIVLFYGKEFKSKPKPSKKDAEQDAAEEALKFLGNEDSEVSNEKNESPSAELQVMDSTLSTQQKGKNYKNLLQEKAQKQKIPYPIYFNKKTDTGFLSEVMYDGGTYSPVMDPQNRKVDAEQKAAQFVLTYLDREEERSEPTSGNASPPQPDDASDEEGREVSPTKNASKQFKVILNEHVQKITKGQLPEYKAEKNSDGKFVCTVTVFGEVYKSPSGMNSISDAKESAASEACKVLQLAETVSGNSPRPADLDSKKEEIPLTEPTSDETDGATPRKCSTKITTGATSTSKTSPSSVDRPDGKTYKSMLNEYAQKMGAKTPEYEVIPGSDENKGFRSKVTVLDKIFECTEFYPSKTACKEMAAMEAMKYFNGLSTNNSSATIPAVSPLDSTKIEQDNSSPATVAQVTPAISTEASVAEISIGSIEPGVEQASGVGAVKPSSEITLSGSPDRRQTPTPKTPANFKNALQEYVQKRKLDQGLRYVSTQDPTTKEHLSKVFVGKRCFKGKQPKAKTKEAEKHVAEVALKTLEGRGGKPDRKCEELLKEYHKDFGFPTFPKYEETRCSEDGKFNVDVKVKKKYEFVCKDTKSKKKDVDMWLAEEAVKALEEENKMTPAQENAKSRLNLFFQSQDGDSKMKCDVQGGQAEFTGRLCFYAVDVYESLTPQQSKEEAITSAAMSACNGMDLH